MRADRCTPVGRYCATMGVLMLVSLLVLGASLAWGQTCEQQLRACQLYAQYLGQQRAQAEFEWIGALSAAQPTTTTTLPSLPMSPVP